MAHIASSAAWRGQRRWPEPVPVLGSAIHIDDKSSADAPGHQRFGARGDFSQANVVGDGAPTKIPI